MNSAARALLTQLRTQSSDNFGGKDLAVANIMEAAFPIENGSSVQRLQTSEDNHITPLDLENLSNSTFRH